MKRNYLKMLSALFIVILLMTGCKKTLEEEWTETGGQNESARANQTNKCRLVSNQGDDDLLQTFQYNAQGLVDQWDFSVTWYNDGFTFEYDGSGKVIKARYHYLGEFQYTLVPEYEEGRIVKETWYVGETDIIDDQAFLTYNDKGQLINKQSILYDYSVFYKYDAVGNAYKEDWFDTNGNPVYDITYHFTKPIKNPMLLAHGIPPGIAWQVYQWSPWRQTGNTTIIFDEEGNPFTLWDQDPETSILTSGARNYAAYQNFYDQFNDYWYEQSWSFDNCGPNENSSKVSEASAKTTQRKSLGVNGNVAKGNSMPLLHGPMKIIKARTNEMRKQLKK